MDGLGMVPLLVFRENKDNKGIWMDLVWFPFWFSEKTKKTKTTRAYGWTWYGPPSGFQRKQRKQRQQGHMDGLGMVPLLRGQSWLKGLQRVQFECPRHSHAWVKFRSLSKYEDKVGSRGCKNSSLNAPGTHMPEWNSEVEAHLITKLAQGAPKGPVWMPQALNCLSEIQKLKRIWGQSWLKGLQRVQFECPMHSYAWLQFRSWSKFENKVGSRGCKGPSLNAPGTHMPEWNSEV